MAIDFDKYISADQQAALVAQRVDAWVADAFGHKLNRDAILAADSKADVSEQDAALVVLEKAIGAGDVATVAIAAKVAAAVAAAGGKK